MKLIRILSRKESGFTLIELLMTIVVMAIIAVPVSLIVVQHIESTFTASQQTLAMNLARLEMERLRNMPYDTLPGGTTFFADYEGYNVDVRTIISKASTGPEGLATISVVVLESGTGNVLNQLFTYKTRNVIYGT